MELSLDQKTPQRFFSSSSLEFFPQALSQRPDLLRGILVWCDTLAVKVTRRQLEVLRMEI